MRGFPRFFRAWKRTAIKSRHRLIVPSCWHRSPASDSIRLISQKDQAGLRIVDRDGRDLYSFDRPERVYPSYSSIPPLVVQTLLFIENRHMLDSRHPTRNPAVEWDRLGKAVLDYSLHTVDSKHHVVGGSTLATQLEKLRHSPRGRTSSPVDKLRQMTSATLAAYQEGWTTLARPAGHHSRLHQFHPAGRVSGLRRRTGPGRRLVGLVRRRCFERSIRCYGRPKRRSARAKCGCGRERIARRYRCCWPCARRTFTWCKIRKALETQTDRYLRALAERGIISHRLRDLALRANHRTIAPSPGAVRGELRRQQGSR